ncbi:MAG: hypothetical protein HY043_09890 [Verrucomicrobia bacterium]|nr:hypothetical protein [Verrucomicrobiota bacterium]
MPKSTVTIFDAKSAVTLPPGVNILSPTNGQFFQAGAEIQVTASAQDPDGTVKSVEFFANGKSLGVATNNPASAKPIDVFQLSFKKSTPGVYLLTAIATDNQGATTTSVPVAIRVLAERVPNVVTITATNPLATELNPGAPGKFAVRRTGSLQTKLNVRYAVSGTASNGVDYAKLSGLVVIPAGAASANINVVPVPDKAIEGDETVTLKLQQLVFIQQPPPEDDYTVGQPDSATVTITEKPSTNIPPKVDITVPKDGEIFVAPANLVIEAATADADGKVVSVSFFADGNLLGVDTKSPFRITWHNVKAGSYKLTAEAKDDQGATTKSAPITIKVVEQNLTPTVTIIAKDKTVAEANSKNPGSFKISRTGEPRTKLNVRYSVSGSAQNGVDYEKLSGEAVIPAGEDEVEIKVVPIPDKISEGDETVIVTLTQLVFIVKPGPEDDYFVGSPKSATITILDAPVPNPRPAIEISSPKNGVVFPSGSDIPVTAIITAAAERVDQVSFSIGDQFLAVVTAPPYGFVWRNVPPGTYKLVASAILGGDMAISSSAVVVIVQAVPTVPFVKRRLPPGYVPGQALQVILQTGPNENTVTHAVEDEPPAGWIVSAISDGGVFDSAHGRVKFGPFFDSKPRALTYEVTPPAKETGAKKFNGNASSDGVQSAVVGDDTLGTF